MASNYPLIFITGTSGAGKSTLVNNLKNRLPQDAYVIYDFDHNGVPADADSAWRIQTTQYWLKKAQEKENINKTFIVCGVTVPAEIIACDVYKNRVIYFGFINVCPHVVRERLLQRNWSAQLIEDNIQWSYYLYAQIIAHKNNFVVSDFGHYTAVQIGDMFVQLIKNIHAAHSIK